MTNSTQETGQRFAAAIERVRNVIATCDLGRVDAEDLHQAMQNLCNAHEADLRARTERPNEDGMAGYLVPKLRALIEDWEAPFSEEKYTDHEIARLRQRQRDAITLKDIIAAKPATSARTDANTLAMIFDNSIITSTDAAQTEKENRP